ncbi:hypothetical protein D3C71_1085350 [compost metagenome]
MNVTSDPHTFLCKMPELVTQNSFKFGEFQTLCQRKPDSQFFLYRHDQTEPAVGVTNIGIDIRIEVNVFRFRRSGVFTNIQNVIPKLRLVYGIDFYAIFRLMISDFKEKL